MQSGLSGPVWLRWAFGNRSDMNAKLRWSTKHPLVDVPPEQLARCLGNVAAECEKAGVPFIVDVTVHDHEMLLGVGLPQSFVHIEALTGKAPYFITLGDPTAVGAVSFSLHGVHPTEIPRRNLISTPDALRVAREFLERGQRSNSVEWEEL